MANNTLNTITHTYVVHGLHQNSWVTKPLAKKLSLYGLTARTVRYYSLKDTIDIHAERLHTFLECNHDPNVPFHLVAHSLGGLVVRHFLANFSEWQIGRVVTLGTPHNGSICADYTMRFAKFLIGNAYQNALDGNCVALTDRVELGIIAGDSTLGLGLPFLTHYLKTRAPDDKRHDGTVLVSETFLPNSKEHIILPVTHTALLTDKKVAYLTANFLKTGSFYPKNQDT